MPYPFTECADCKEEKTGLQQKRQRCRSCGNKGKTHMKGKTLTPETCEKLSAALKGKTHSLEARQAMSLGKGGDGDVLNREYPGLPRWTRLVKERDGYKCAECDFQGTKGKKDVDAHHVIPKAAAPELATVLFNGVTLCKPCHKDIHAT